MMEVVLHLGAHATDGGRIAGWLARNEHALAARGLALPPPRDFLRRISQALVDQGGKSSTPEQEAALLAALGATDGRERIVVSAPGLLGPATAMIEPEGFYVKDVARRVYGLRSLFPNSRLAFLLAVRRASGIVPGLLAADPGRAPEAVIPLLDDETLPWSPLVSILRRQAPAATLTVWRHESLPQVWPQVLAALVGPGNALPPAGLLDFAAEGLSAEARLRAARYLQANPPASVGQLQRVVALFGARFGKQGETADDIKDLPDWALRHLARLDMSYETEWADLSHIDGVRALG